MRGAKGNLFEKKNIAPRKKSSFSLLFEPIRKGLGLVICSPQNVSGKKNNNATEFKPDRKQKAPLLAQGLNVIEARIGKELNRSLHV